MTWMGYYGITKQGTGKTWAVLEPSLQWSLLMFIQKGLPDLPRAVLGTEGSLLLQTSRSHSWVGHAGLQKVLICPEWTLLLEGE